MTQAGSPLTAPHAHLRGLFFARRFRLPLARFSLLFSGHDPTQKNIVQTIIVRPGPVVGWEVALVGLQQHHQFIDRRLAVDYARSWAAANRPSCVQVLDRNGGAQTIVEFGPYLLPA